MSQIAVVPQSPSLDEAAAARPISRQPSSDLLMAWLLLLLNDRAIHGYELRRQLEANGVATEAGALYRMLRKLERDGCAASTWAKSVAGPRRRMYQLTAKGRRHLDELVGAITATRDVHADFLRAHGSVQR